eukprot:364364-Chlamydomonas_euryale.AAC.2
MQTGIAPGVAGATPPDVTHASCSFLHVFGAENGEVTCKHMYSPFALVIALSTFSNLVDPCGRRGWLPGTFLPTIATLRHQHVQLGPALCSMHHIEPCVAADKTVVKRARSELNCALFILVNCVHACLLNALVIALYIWQSSLRDAPTALSPAAPQPFLSGV